MAAGGCAGKFLGSAVFACFGTAVPVVTSVIVVPVPVAVAVESTSNIGLIACCWVGLRRYTAVPTIPAAATIAHALTHVLSPGADDDDDDDDDEVPDAGIRSLRDVGVPRRRLVSSSMTIMEPRILYLYTQRRAADREQTADAETGKFSCPIPTIFSAGKKKKKKKIRKPKEEEATRREGPSHGDHGGNTAVAGDGPIVVFVFIILVPVLIVLVVPPVVLPVASVPRGDAVASKRGGSLVLGRHCCGIAGIGYVS